MTLIQELKTICKDVHGTFLSIGLKYPTVESVIEKNKDITNGYILEFDGKKKGKGKNRFTLKSKKISIKKLRNSFKKKSIDTMVCNYQDIEKYMRYFVKDSVYINKGKLYLYGKKEDYVIEDIENYYKRYQTKIIITEYEEDFLIEIDNTNSKNNWFKDKVYKIKDTISTIINIIGDIMIG